MSLVQTTVATSLSMSAYNAGLLPAYEASRQCSTLSRTRLGVGTEWVFGSGQFRAAAVTEVAMLDTVESLGLLALCVLSIGVVSTTLIFIATGSSVVDRLGLGSVGSATTRMQICHLGSHLS